MATWAAPTITNITSEGFNISWTSYPNTSYYAIHLMDAVSNNYGAVGITDNSVMINSSQTSGYVSTLIDGYARRAHILPGTYQVTVTSDQSSAQDKISSPVNVTIPTPPPIVDCTGTWSVCTGNPPTKTFTITTPASGGGKACPTSPSSCPVNCQGTWSSCDSPAKTQKFTITTPASGGGTNCTDANNTVRDCPTPAPGSTCAENWGACSQDCGGGTQSFIDTDGTCTNPSDGDHRACNTQSCNAGAAINCEGSWGICDSDGTQTYNISKAMANGGIPCPFTDGDLQDCVPDYDKNPKKTGTPWVIVFVFLLILLFMAMALIWFKLP
jgi:hypothetical protein